MDKRLLQLYAVWAKDNLENQVEVSLKTLGIFGDKEIRNAKLVGDVTVIDGDANSYPRDMFSKRNSIVNLVKEEGYKNVIEEFAYTWFNRFVALRFMEVHDFLPHGFRVLSSRDGGVEPEILKNLNFVRDELRLDLNICTSLKEKSGIEELYRYVLFRQCRALSKVLPMLFADENDYLELLLPKTLLLGDTVITKLVALGEESFREDVEVIGWLYQFYVAEDREEFRKATLVTKELIPTLTQVFTPDWIVRYMAENSIGRLWLESYPNSALRKDMKYYVDNPEQPDDVQRQLDTIKYQNVNPEDIRIIEPCCGSGHILVYVFDLLYKMYEEKGYSNRDIPTLILSKNLYGLDIDKRASQLAAFSLVMKARSLNARFFSSNYYVKPQVYEVWDSRLLFALNYKQDLQELNALTSEEIGDIEYLANTFRYAKTIGSLLLVRNMNWERIDKTIYKLENDVVSSVFNFRLLSDGVKLIKKLVCQAKILAGKYDVMITNPPYMGISKLEAPAKTYLTDNYPNSKADMFAMFMEAPFTKGNGFKALVNPDSWMFLVSFEELRKKLIFQENIVTMIHLGLGAFDAVVQTTSFVIRNSKINSNGVYFRLVDSKNKEIDFVNALTNGGGVRFIANATKYTVIPTYPIAYWVKEGVLDAFTTCENLAKVASPRQGLATGDNGRFLRLWYEVQGVKTCFTATDSINAFAIGAKWFPCNKGGDYRKWYGNNEYVVNWERNGFEICNFKDENGKLRSRPQNKQFYFLEGGTWSTLSSADFSMRYCPKGFIFETKGSMIFAKDGNLKYIIGLLNSKIIQQILKILSPTLDYHEGPLGKVPVKLQEEYIEKVEQIVTQNIQHSRNDWDSFEPSWDFKKHPLI